MEELLKVRAYKRVPIYKETPQVVKPTRDFTLLQPPSWTGCRNSRFYHAGRRRRKRVNITKQFKVSILRVPNGSNSKLKHGR
jgi:hypothetical protein